MESPPIAVLVSGSGRSLENLVQRSRAGELDCDVRFVLSDRPGIGALERAERLGVEALCLPYRDFAGWREFSERAFHEIDARGCVLVVLAGFLRRLKVPAHWQGRVINIHPALLPKFGGKGFYGERVHRAVLEAGETTSGCTVHRIDDRYDEGEIVLQRQVPVLPNDTPDTLAARVFAEECEALPEAIRAVLHG